MQQGEQLSSPVERKQTTPPSEELDNGTVFNIVGLSMVVSVVVGVVLLYYAFRARWACWLAPLAWLVGEFVYGVIDHYAPIADTQV